MNRLLLITLLFASVAHTQWSTNPANNLIVGYGQNQQLCSDGAGGCYITYTPEIVAPYTIRVVRLNRFGYNAWGGYRIISGTDSLPSAFLARIVEDGRGGVIIVYDESYIQPPTIISRTKVHKIDSSGNFFWGPTGVRVTLSETSQGGGGIVPDGSGGCIVTWGDSLGLRINRIDATGTRAWGDSGNSVGPSSSTLLMADDGRGGCYIMFWVGRLQRFDPQGNTYWLSPVQIPTSGSVLRVDRAANVYLLGRKVLGYRNGELLFTVNLQKVDTTGSLLWDSLGVVLDTINANNFPPFFGLTLSAGHGTVGWPQRIAGQWDSRMQLVRSDGSALFPLGGRSISRLPSTRYLVGMLPSDSSTTLFAFGDSRASGGMYGQRLDTTGTALWDTNDVLLNFPEFVEMTVTTDGNGGCIGVGFHQFDHSIRALQVSKNGILGQVITSVKNVSENSVPDRPVLFQNYPNPFNGATNIRFATPHSGLVRLTLYNILGQQLLTLLNAPQEAGEHTGFFSAGSLPSGTYICKLETPRGSATRRLILIK